MIWKSVTRYIEQQFFFGIFFSIRHDDDWIKTQDILNKVNFEPKPIPSKKLLIAFGSFD